MESIMRLMRRDWCGPSIREMREKLGLSQTKFGERFGIPLRTLQHWEAYEKGEPLMQEVVKDGRKPPYYVYVLLHEIIFQEDARD